MRAILYAGMIVAGAIFTLALAFGFFQGVGDASAQVPQIIKQKPIGTGEVLKVKSIDIQDEKIGNQDLDLAVDGTVDGLGIEIKAINKTDKETDIQADVWQVSIRGALFEIRPDEFVAADSPLAAGESKVLKALDLSQWLEELEAYPGRYTLVVEGLSDEYAIAKAQELDAQGVEYETNELAMYKLQAEVVVGFDEELIKAKGNVLEKQNVEIAIDGSNPFEVTQDSNRNIIISVVNTKDFPVSGMIYNSAFTVWSAEYTRAEGYDSLKDYDGEECGVVLQPGESVEINSFTLDIDAYPLGGDGLSKMQDNGSIAKPGMYVVGVDGSTLPCTLDDQQIPGLVFNGKVAFEVK